MPVILLGLALALAAAAPPEKPPTTTGFIAFDPIWEQVLIGKPATGAAPNATFSTVDADVRGKFVERAGALRMVETATWGETTWLAKSPHGDLESGLVRARLLVGARLDTTILVRALGDDAPGKDGELDSGYGVVVERDKIRLFRWEHKVQRWVGVEAKFEPQPKGAVLELVVLLAGPAISASLYDGATFAHRATVTAHDRWAARGRVGMRVRAGQDGDSGISLLSVGRTGPTAELTKEDRGAGVERLVVVDLEQLLVIPPDARKNVVRTDAQERRAYIVTDPIGHERVLRAGVTPIAQRTQMPWKYVDSTTRERLSRGTAPTKTMGGFRVDESYKDAATVEALLKAYAERFPKITKLHAIGTSLEGRTIWALKISDNPELDEDEPAVMLDGAHHGGELMSIEFVVDAIQQLVERYAADPWTRSAVNAMEIWCVPLVNVDGNTRYVHETRDYDRKNARDIDNNGKIDGWDGVDLYRNYPVRWGGLGEIGSRSNPFHYRYRGPEPASEPEIRAMMALAARERFVASIDFHTNATKVLVPYTDPSMKNPDVNEAWTIAEEIVAPMPVQVNGAKYVVARNLYPVDGTAQDYFRFAFGTVALLVEGPLNNPQPYAKFRPSSIVGTRGTWINLLKRVQSGPGVMGHVRDATGSPLEAEVIIDEMAPKEGECWTSRPRDGRFQRLLPGAGTYTVRVRYQGGEKTKKVSVVDGETARVDFVVP